MTVSFSYDAEGIKRRGKELTWKLYKGFLIASIIFLSIVVIYVVASICYADWSDWLQIFEYSLFALGSFGIFLFGDIKTKKSLRQSFDRYQQDGCLTYTFEGDGETFKIVVADEKKILTFLRADIKKTSYTQNFILLKLSMANGIIDLPKTEEVMRILSGGI